MAYRVPEEDKALSLKDKIDSAHLLRAIENSVEHHGETAHGVTGLAFEKYVITVHKRTGLCWLVECRFKAREAGPASSLRDQDAEHDKGKHSSRRNPEDGRNAS